MNENDLQRIRLSQRGTEDREVKEYIYSIFQLEDLRYLIENKIKPKGIQIRVKENQEMITKIRIYAQRYDIPIYDSSEGEISYKGSKIRREVNDNIEQCHIDLSECQLNESQLTFYEMTNLLTIQLPTTITFIPDTCFMGCLRLSGIQIPKQVKSIGKASFFGCQSLRTIILPTTIREYPEKAFGQCIQLEKIVYQEDIQHPITKLGPYCFANCYSLASIDLSNTELRILPKYCFMNCYNLTKITISSRLGEIGDRCFKNCGIINYMDLPGTIYSYGKEAFMGCTALQSLKIYEGTEELPDRCFSNCGFVTVEIPTTVTHMGENVFSGCERLMYVKGLDRVFNLNREMFSGTPFLAHIEKEERHIREMELAERQREEEFEDLKDRISKERDKEREREKEERKKMKEKNVAEMAEWKADREREIRDKEREKKVYERQKDLLKLKFYFSERFTDEEIERHFANYDFDFNFTFEKLEEERERMIKEGEELIARVKKREEEEYKKELENKMHKLVKEKVNEGLIDKNKEIERLKKQIEEEREKNRKLNKDLEGEQEKNKKLDKDLEDLRQVKVEQEPVTPMFNFGGISVSTTMSNTFGGIPVNTKTSNMNVQVSTEEVNKNGIEDNEYNKVEYEKPVENTVGFTFGQVKEEKEEIHNERNETEEEEDSSESEEEETEEEETKPPVFSFGGLGTVKSQMPIGSIGTSRFGQPSSFGNKQSDVEIVLPENTNVGTSISSFFGESSISSTCIF